MEDVGFEPTHPKELIYSQPRLTSMRLSSKTVTCYFVCWDLNPIDPAENQPLM